MGRRTLWLLAALLLLCGGCGGSDFDLGVDSPPINVEGTYVSGDTGGALGHLTLQLALRENAMRTYDASLVSQDNPDFGESVGLGTLGNEHLILNFDRGKDTDYYFEGTVQLSASGITGIEGSFIFPDQSEPLAASFTLQ